MDRFKHFKAEAIIFDKDGTLIDFDAMWGGWTIHLAGQLHQISGLNVREPLCRAMGYDEAGKKVLPHGMLASNPMAKLYRLTVEVMQSLGLSAEEAKRVVEKGWCIPDPILLAKPFTDTRALFSSLHSKGIKIAIATADDRAPTQAMIEAFDIEEYIASMICADDGIPSKPAPDMVLSLCERMKIQPAKVMVVGDTVSDLKMAHVAGAGLAVGVLSGVSSARDLAAHADLLLESVDELHVYAENQSAVQTQNGFNPDFAF
ncbi:MAG: HAD family hydrolase [Chloroflexi bacterium]|nr:HAD family hydrolase [Chloroflexota bacterium]